MPPRNRSGHPDGITARHRRECSSAGTSDWRCGCPSRYQVQVWSKRDQRRLSRTFGKLAEANTWKRDADHAIAAGVLIAGGSGGRQSARPAPC